jgi:dihydrofolate synthase/folylpolyglutamate synthase
LIAFLHFSDEKVDFAVIEVGMGGRLDATNIIEPRLSVITSISYDHREHLGGTLEAIAFEKGGIIKSATPVILGANIEPLSIFQKIAVERESPMYIAAADEDFELQNRNTASLALAHVGVTISLDVKKKGLSIRPRCRFEIIRKIPLVILDVAHNEAGIEALFKKTRLHFPTFPITVVAAFSCPYKAPLMGRLIQSRADKVYFTQANHERSTPPPDVQGCSIEPNVAQALSLAEREVIQKGGLLLVTGTFFMMPEVLEFFGVKEVKGSLCD